MGEYELIAASPEILKKIDLAGPTDARILISGETGTGKTLLARTLHERHPSRSKHEFRRTNVGALVPELAASQLFGHTKGAFTGAAEDVEGIVLEAHQGTLFLDEISGAPQNVQVMLLTLLETKRINPVGAKLSTKRPEVDVRIISASTETPESLLALKTFRKDLYFRLVEFHIAIPPLRDRRDEIPALAEHFLRRAQRAMRFDIEPVSSIDKRAIEKLCEYDWPGNVRELDHVIRAALVRSREVPTDTKLREQWIEFSVRSSIKDDNVIFDESRSWHETKLAFQRRWAEEALKSCNGVIRTAAAKFGIDAKTLTKYIRKRLPRQRDGKTQ